MGSSCSSEFGQSASQPAEREKGKLRQLHGRIAGFTSRANLTLTGAGGSGWAVMPCRARLAHNDRWGVPVNGLSRRGY
jgi:hypothetical protein